jgi:hypothetical protein
MPDATTPGAGLAESEPVSVTLLSGPGAHGYGTTETIPAGPGGGKLHIPAPFDITVDTSTTPTP